MRQVEQRYEHVGDEQLGWADIKESQRVKQVLYAEAIGLETLTLGDKKEEMLKLNYKGVFGYLPKSRIDNYEFKGLHHFLGKEFEFVVETVDIDGHWFLADRIQSLEVSARRFWKSAKVGQIVVGFIRGMDMSRLYLLVEGVPTVMSREEVSYSYIDDMRSEFEIGDTLDIKITKLEAPNEENPDGLLEVNAKVLSRDPWAQIADYKEGGSYTAVITKIHPEHGVFLELLGSSGLIVRTNFPPNANPDVLKKGKKVTVKILEINHRDRRIKAITILPQRSINAGSRRGVRVIH
ncbi:S1 RNA-binding domain-containing protein [Paenibacillus illinoisensis]|uniref:S1 RNA-binding domain-containing protein n=1 Tax=Paenibacillus illinoisensis TaxID=59845 RepID=UPI001C8D8396|nr:S1 RNA-binding domain-containing protein [Paenibacillus illinoisensis]MBY0217954.1 30S ribosomal protein S1 [Paenibacillus illinoisensis]